MSDRDELAVLVNGRPLPVNPTTIGGIYERAVAYERADSIIAAGWTNLDDARTVVDGLWEMTRKAVALEQERDHALTELERLRNTPCFECGHS